MTKKKKETKYVRWKDIPVGGAYKYGGIPWRKVTPTHGKCSHTGLVAKPLPDKINQLVFEVDIADAG